LASGLHDGRSAGAPRVKASLLRTTRRRDGRLQVTYAGKPLYYYAHEGPGEVECHNVNLNGGFWWVIGPNGKRRR
jgi:predicted lipoprotein with Yx(FWY)xxD motif